MNVLFKLWVRFSLQLDVLWLITTTLLIHYWYIFIFAEYIFFHYYSTHDQIVCSSSLHRTSDLDTQLHQQCFESLLHQQISFKTLSNLSPYVPPFVLQLLPCSYINIYFCKSLWIVLYICFPFTSTTFTYLLSF